MSIPLSYGRVAILLCRKLYLGYFYPVLLNELVWGSGFTMYSVILGHLGSDAVAANSIANIAKNLLICGCVGFGYGGSIIVGNLLGQGSLSEAGKCGNTLCKIAVFKHYRQYKWLKNLTETEN